MCGPASRTWQVRNRVVEAPPVPLVVEVARCLDKCPDPGGGGPTGQPQPASTYPPLSRAARTPRKRELAGLPLARDTPTPLRHAAVSTPTAADVEDSLITAAAGTASRSEIRCRRTTSESRRRSGHSQWGARRGPGTTVRPACREPDVRTCRWRCCINASALPVQFSSSVTSRTTSSQVGRLSDGSSRSSISAPSVPSSVGRRRSTADPTGLGAASYEGFPPEGRTRQAALPQLRRAGRVERLKCRRSSRTRGVGRPRGTVTKAGRGHRGGRRAAIPRGRRPRARP